VRPDDLHEVLRRQPFVPFRRYLSTGETFDVRHRENALVGRAVVVLHVPALNLPLPAGTPRVIVSLLHVVKIEVPEI
jgi:hypothetical protein